jgi:hypothetical protein
MRDLFDCPTTTFATKSWRVQHRPRSLICACAVASAALVTLAAAQETPPEIIAAHIRQQGYACEKALSAQRDPKASKADEPMWTLRCSNASYRVRLIPDMAAKVDVIKNGKQPR